MNQPPEDEVLVSGRPRRGGWLVAVVVVLALLGWLILREPAAPRVAPVAVPTDGSSSPPPPPPPEPAPPAPTLEQVVFLDEASALALRSDCPPSRGQSGVCRRTLLATQDAGVTFDALGVLPVSADMARRLLADPDGVVAVVDEQRLTTLVRSFDGGRTWAQVGLAEGAPAPLPDRAPPLTLPVQGCPGRCGDLVWIDVVTATIHALPAQPGGSAGGFWYPSPATRDGVIAATNGLGVVAVSGDRGVTWTRSVLPVGSATRSGLPVLLATGARRVYAFLTVVDAAGSATDLGFRTDDAGISWRDIGYPSRPVDGLPPQDVPGAVLDGEVLTTNDRDGVLRSRGGGTAFTEIPGSPEEVRLSQEQADGPVLATGYDGARTTYWLSRDGRGWTPLRLPGG